MGYKKTIIEKIHYSVSDVAKIIDVSDSNIRHWSKEFDYIKPYRNSRGVRYYSKEDIDEFILIKHLLKECKYTTAGAKEKIKEDRKKVSENATLVYRLNEIKKMLLDIKAQI